MKASKVLDEYLKDIGGLFMENGGGKDMCRLELLLMIFIQRNINYASQKNKIIAQVYG